MTDLPPSWHDGPCPVCRFTAMAGPCEILFDGVPLASARPIGEAVVAETRRIEAKFSRFRDDSVIGRINAGAGTPFTVDAETAQLLAFAETCHRLSEGRFDITAGALFRLWHFDGGEHAIPDETTLAGVLALVGWHRASWQAPVLGLQSGMALDLGGLGKEYAVDRGIALARAADLDHVLVNFGGDLAVSGPRANGSPWQVGCWDDLPQDRRPPCWQLRHGAIATSGTTRRFFLHEGRRFGHILDARNGRPVPDAPLSVSVAAASCIEAGFLATLAMLHGAHAEVFLADQNTPHRCLRESH